MNPSEMAKMRAGAGARRRARAQASDAEAHLASPTPRPRDPEATAEIAPEAGRRPVKKIRVSKKGASSSHTVTEAAEGRSRGEDVSVLDDWDTASQIFKSALRPVDADRITGDGNPHYKRDAIECSLKILHFMDAYCSLRGEVEEGRRKISSLNERLEADRSLIASLEREKQQLLKEKEEGRVLQEDLRGQIATAGPEAVEAYKASRECHEAKLAFSEPIFDAVTADTCQRIQARYPDLDLEFIYDPDPGEAPGAGGGAGGDPN